MRFLRLRPPRTVLTVLLTLAIGFTLAEEVVADVHDGGATHAEIDRATGVNHADEQGEAGAAFHSDPAGGPAESDHPAHVCHCTHAHGGVVVVVQLQTARLRAPDTQLFPPTAALRLGIAAPPVTRPPIS